MAPGATPEVGEAAPRRRAGSALEVGGLPEYGGPAVSSTVEPQLGFLGPLKGSFKGDIDIDIDMFKLP